MSQGYIKEWMLTPVGTRVYSIRTTTYAQSLLHMLEMFKMAYNDFYDLLAQDVSVVRFTGKRHKHQFAIQWIDKSNDPHPGYTQVPDLPE